MSKKRPNGPELHEVTCDPIPVIHLQVHKELDEPQAGLSVDLRDEAPIQKAEFAIKSDDKVAGMRVSMHKARVQELDKITVK